MTRMSRLENRRGVALVVALIAIIVVGAMVTGLWASSTLEQRTDENSRRQAQAMAVAEAAAGEIVGNWNYGTYNNMATGATSAVSGTSPSGTGSYTGNVTRINSQFFLVDVTGTDRGTKARQRVALLVKLRLLTFDIQGALTTRGPGTIGGSVNIDGTDTRPWSSCPPAGPERAGIREPASDLNFIGACSGASCITGSPAVSHDATVSDNTFFNYGPDDWAALSASATILIPASSTLTGLSPSYTGSTCNAADQSNWGEPDEITIYPNCRSYMPVMYAAGDLRISNGRGQGILMVNGDLSLSGNFVFDGIVVVRGHLSTTGTGNHITGGVLAANVDLENDQVLGNAVIQYSSCSINQAATGSSPGAMLRSRGWMQVY